MKELTKSAVTSWSAHGIPQSISVSCGHCGSREFFRPNSWSQDGSCRYANALCPNCHDHSFFAIAGYSSTAEKLGGGCLFVHPSRKEWLPSAELSDKLSAENNEIQRDYEMAVKYFNTGDPAAVVLAARRMLEGMAAQFLPANLVTRVLSRDLATMSKERDLSPVLAALSTALKNAGNMGAHYGASRVTTEIAEHALQLSEELLKLHFLLKQRVDHLQELIAAVQARKPALRPKDEANAE